MLFLNNRRIETAMLQSSRTLLTNSSDDVIGTTAPGIPRGFAEIRCIGDSIAVAANGTFSELQIKTRLYPIAPPLLIGSSSSFSALNGEGAS